MIKSMTGYGRAQIDSEGKLITVEIKSVNHRYFDFSARAPRIYGYLEEALKSFMLKVISRGKVDVYVSIENTGEEPTEVMLNKPLLSGYLNAFNEIKELYYLEDDITISTIAQNHDIFNVKKQEEDRNVITTLVLNVAQKAVEDFMILRTNEGQKLSEDIKKRCKIIDETVNIIENRSPETVKEYREKLLGRMKEVLNNAEIDENRILLEAAIYADKITVAEETVRLKSHVEHILQMLESNEPIGKKLDFMVQEMNREINTIGSKANDISLSRLVVDIKSEIENIREQVQNIE